MCDDTTPIPLAAGEHPPMPGAVKVASEDFALTRHHSARTKARKAALDVLYEADLRGLDILDVLEERGNVREFTEQIVRGVYVYCDAIDQRIVDSATGDWTLGRMPRVDRNLARIAIWEMDYTSTAPKTAISEAIELAHELSTDDSVGFLNGLLGKAATTRPRKQTTNGD